MSSRAPWGCRYKEAVNECTAALDAQPGYHKALTRRAKAYEQMGHYKQALSDVQKANKGSDATPETQVHVMLMSGSYCAMLPVATHLHVVCPLLSMMHASLPPGSGAGVAYQLSICKWLLPSQSGHTCHFCMHQCHHFHGILYDRLVTTSTTAICPSPTCMPLNTQTDRLCNVMLEWSAHQQLHPTACTYLQEAEKRLKDLMSGKRPSGNNTLATANGTTAAAKKQPTRQQRSQPYVFQAKIQLDDETRSMHMTGQVTYAELQHAVKEKFPGAGPLILKYLDRYFLALLSA